MEKPAVSRRAQPAWLKSKKATATLLEVDAALLDYQRERQKEKLETVKQTLTNWGNSDAFAQMAASSARKQVIEPVLQEFAYWLKTEFRRLERFEYRDVLSTFSLAAQCLLNKFPMMPGLYRGALQETFLAPGSGSEPLYCIKWYQNQGEWEARVKQMGDTSNAASSSNAFTITWPEGNHLRATKHKQWSEPFNRAVEFVKVDQGTFTHELLHWCTHESFKNYIEDNYARRSDDYNFLKEALTEWLKRYATGDPGSGGYPWEYREAVQVAEHANISELELAEAYLGGIDVAETIGRLLKAKKENAEGPSKKCDRGSYNVVLNFFAEKRPTIKMRTPHNDEVLTKNMFMGFREDGLTAEEIQRITSKRWAEAYAVFQTNPK
jgi:hypothetical protein